MIMNSVFRFLVVLGVTSSILEAKLFDSNVRRPSNDYQLPSTIKSLYTGNGDNSSFLYGQFPEGFIWGLSTASYQVEGAWNVSGKGENIWDRFCHTKPWYTRGQTGDVACDSYDKWEEDVQLLKNIGVNVYRFSFSWSRLLPNSTVDTPNPDGIRYYNDLINELLDNGIQPVVTLYHWDLPQPLQDIGGWPTNDLIPYFVDYARFCFQTFGDRVKHWITFNEPHSFAETYEGGGEAPGISDYGVAFYQVIDTVLKAHASTWHLYNDEFRDLQNGFVGITLDSRWYAPNNTDNAEDIEAADTAWQFGIGILAKPIFSANGDYPEVVRDLVDQHSFEEGLTTSRLPYLTQEWIDYIKGSSDFFGFNHYSTSLCSKKEWNSDNQIPSLANDEAVKTTFDPSWTITASHFSAVVPWGFRKALNRIRLEYNNPPVIITENGFNDATGQIIDPERIEYYRDYIDEMLKAVLVDDCDVKGYISWSLIDNFEWDFGYKIKYGVVNVNFTDPERTIRTPKLSSKYLKLVFGNNGFPNTTFQEEIEKEALAMLLK